MFPKNFPLIKEKTTRYVIGMLSGTSADGIDVALCECSGIPQTESYSIKLKKFLGKKYSTGLQKKIHSSSKTSSVQEIAELDLLLGKEFAAAVNDLLAEEKISSQDVDIIGSHGQTIYHHSRRAGALKATLQLGCGDMIAFDTGIPVIFDFRRKDIVAGGEGAPLTPYCDFFLFKKNKDETGKAKAVLNLGGIGNITVLGATLDDVYGFDTGPANAPLDRLAKLFTNNQNHFDENGEFARKGKILPELLAKLISEDEFLKLSPPKSSGIEAYGEKFIEKISLYSKEKKIKIDEDVFATVTEFIAHSIADSLEKFVPQKISELIVAGGGSHNTFLLERIQKLCGDGVKVSTSDKHGVPVDAREAIAFALLADHALFNVATSLPKVTGAKKAMVLGKIVFP